MSIKTSIRQWLATSRGNKALKQWQSRATTSKGNPSDLEKFFDARQEGHGIWKWRHYFDIYDRHLSKFRGKQINVLEIGVYSGGSLEMWAEYFGSQAKIYGADIAPECKAYENNQTRIFIGDQEDRQFWKAVRAEVPSFDIVIDDGGHKAEQQIVTLEELVPYMSPGGVFICEDIHGRRNPFAGYMAGLTNQLHSNKGSSADSNSWLKVPASPFQANVDSIHNYPFLSVLELRQNPVGAFTADRHGTIWQPFLDPFLPVTKRQQS